MQSELDLLKQENARLMTRIAELEQRETENAELKAKVDDFLDLTYKDKVSEEQHTIEQGIIQEVILFIQKGKPLTSSNSICKTQGTNIKVNDDGSGQELAQLFPMLKLQKTITVLKTEPILNNIRNALNQMAKFEVRNQNVEFPNVTVQAFVEKILNHM
ncbi:hypothetical protein Glove_637g32 [Diversispora epigaea]|uniref:Uncharacterized protein n=1 Tax=Diversispora epigaea TaxID=1348612 RepID=A0A397G4S7_9GLOM|nr:hypothetical protein Glove_637g32 [Diversispora epigaea]